MKKKIQTSFRKLEREKNETGKLTLSGDKEALDVSDSLAFQLYSMKMKKYEYIRYRSAMQYGYMVHNKCTHSVSQLSQ